MPVPTPASIKQLVDQKKVESSEKVDSSDSVSTATVSGPSPSLPKKHFERKEHLTQRPFRESQALQDLKKSLTPPKRNSNKENN